MLKHPMFQFIAVCILVLVAIFAFGQNFAQQVASEGIVIGSTPCVWKHKERTCVLVNYKGNPYVVIGNAREDGFFVLYIIDENDKEVWSHEGIGV